MPQVIPVMERKFLSPTNDFVFKNIFADNRDILGDFLKAVLDLPDEEYQGLTVVDPHRRWESIEDKYGVLDLKIMTKSQKTIELELQVTAQPSIWQRIQYYTAKMLVEQATGGDCRITGVISILIADFVLLEGNDICHNRFRLYDEKTAAAFPGYLEINILEIPKVRGEDGSRLGAWLKFFAARTEEEFMKASQNNPAIARAWGIIKTLSEDEESRLLAESREKGRRDFEDRFNGACREGEQKGRLAVAQKLLRNKWPPEVVAENTGLALEEVKRLAAALSG
jgi:predicted transposase/invertase (TIGR01784 family)